MQYKKILINWKYENTEYCIYVYNIIWDVIGILIVISCGLHSSLYLCGVDNIFLDLLAILALPIYILITYAIFIVYKKLIITILLFRYVSSPCIIISMVYLFKYIL